MTDEHVCLSVCLSVCPQAYLRSNMRSLYLTFLCMLPMLPVARSSSNRVTKSQGESAVLGFFFPVDNALYSVAFGTLTKTAEPIKMLFGMMTWAGRGYHVLDGGLDTPRGRGNFGGNVAAHCKLMGHSMVSCAKTAEPIEMY